MTCLEPCLVCGAPDREEGVLCADCRRTLRREDGLLPGNVEGAPPPGTAACLVDRWGRPHGIAASVVLGRTPPHDGFVIHDLAVSRSHAELWRGDGWQVRDLHSTNGTYLNGKRVTERASVAPGAIVQLANVAFFFLPGPVPLAPEAQRPFTAQTGDPTGLHRLQLQPGLIVCSLPEDPEADGIAVVGSRSVKLPRMQLELLGLLVRQGESGKEHGFVSSAQLRRLPWPRAAAGVDDGAIRGLVMRLRNALQAVGLPRRLVANEPGMGYCIDALVANGLVEVARRP